MVDIPTLPDGFRVVEAEQSSDDILKNLFELYLHDMAEWFRFDTTKAGNYAYPTEEIWQQAIDVHLLYYGDIPVGFGLVGAADQWTSDASVSDMDEFFVVRRYRRSGVGRAFAATLWNEYPGPWLVRVFQRNLPAIPFWRSTIGIYASGHHQEEVREIEGKAWSFFRFNTGRPDMQAVL